MSLVGYDIEFKMSIQNGKDQPLIIASLDNDMVEISGVDNNIVTFTIPSTEFDMLAKNYEYEIILTSPGGIVTTYIQGKFSLTQGPA